MDTTLLSQISGFGITFLGGLAIGFVFDLFRVIRKFKKSTTVSVFVEDLGFFILLSFMLFLIVLYANNANVRFYEFFGIVLGLTVYFLFFSKASRKILIFSVKLLLFPVFIVMKLFKKPAAFIIISTNKIKKRISKKLKSIFSYFSKQIKLFLKIRKKI